MPFLVYFSGLMSDIPECQPVNVDQSPFRVLLYYMYAPVERPGPFAKKHRKQCQELGLMGRIIIGLEGINGTVSGTWEATEEYMKVLRAEPGFEETTFKIDPAEDHVFPRMSVKAREEIVTLGLEDDLNPNELTGTHLTPKEFYEAMQEEDVILLDARNKYETDVGHFKGAICPPLDNFRDFPEWIRENLGDVQGKKILTYCTGGIRCEKFSGFLRREGFRDVYQLEGGIVEYGKSEEVKGRDFLGKCYVFDERIVVDVNRTEGDVVISRCVETGKPSSRYVNCLNADCNRHFILSEEGEAIRGRYCSAECREAVEKGTSQARPQGYRGA